MLLIETNVDEVLYSKHKVDVFSESLTLFHRSILLHFSQDKMPVHVSV